MKKVLLVILLFSMSGISLAYKHQIYLGDDFRKYDGKYEFTLNAVGYKTKIWRVEIKNNKPIILTEGARHINPATETKVSYKGSDITIDGKLWCFNYFSVEALSGSLKSQRVESAEIKGLKSCRSHRFDVDTYVDVNGNAKLMIKTIY